MTNGFYTINYAGFGEGFALVALHQGAVVGAGSGGSVWDGRTRSGDDPLSLAAELHVSFPAALVSMVTGKPASAGHHETFLVTFPRRLGAEIPQSVDLSLGLKLQLAVKKIRDLDPKSQG